MPIGEILGLISSFSAVVGLLLVAWQLWETQRARHLQSTIEIFDLLSSEEQRGLRKYVYTRLPADVRAFTEEDFRKAEQVCTAFGRIALLSEKKLADEGIVVRMYSEAIIATWNRLSEYVRYERTLRGPHYLNSFERLARHSQKYWHRHRQASPLPTGMKADIPLDQTDGALQNDDERRGFFRDRGYPQEDTDLAVERIPKEEYNSMFPVSQSSKSMVRHPH